MCACQATHAPLSVKALLTLAPPRHQWKGLWHAPPPHFFTTHRKNGTHNGYAIAFVREPVSHSSKLIMQGTQSPACVIATSRLARACLRTAATGPISICTCWAHRRLISAWKDKLACGMYIPDQRPWGTEGGLRQTSSEARRYKWGGHLLSLEGRGRKASKVIWGQACNESKPRTVEPESEETSSSTSEQRTALWERGSDGNSEEDGFEAPQNCIYNGCISLPEFAEILQNIHNDGKRARLNEHFLPQDLVCFANGATPDKWTRVTTMADKAAIDDLGHHVGLSGLAVDDIHSTGEATQWGEKFEVEPAVLEILQSITRKEKEMFGYAYERFDVMLNGHEFVTAPKS